MRETISAATSQPGEPGFARQDFALTAEIARRTRTVSAMSASRNARHKSENFAP